MPDALRTGISSGHFEWKDLEQAFRRCREDWGFDTIEIWSEQIGYPPPKGTGRELHRLSKKYDVAIGYHAPFFGEYDLAYHNPSRSGLVLKELLGVCRRCHVEFLIVHLGSNPDRDAGLRSAMSAFSQNRVLIEKQHLHIVIETVPSLWGNQVGDRVEDFERIFRNVDRHWLGLGLDYGHAQLNNNCDELIKRLGDKISYAHVHDNRGEADEHLGYGMGVIDWGHVLRRTLRTGFRGPFIIEYPESHGLDKTERFLQDLRTYLREIETSQ